MRGLCAALGGVGGADLTGLMLAGGHLRGERLRGVGTGVYNRVRVVHGLQIGLLNRADELHGVQIGLLNHAGNNPAGTRWLPGLNVHF